MAHRLLICAALSKGGCTVSNISLSNDIKATLNCLCALGVKAKKQGNSIYVDGSGLFSKTDVLDCFESGSTLRFFIPLCLMAKTDVTLKGTERLFSRSLDVYKTLCDERGFKFYEGSDRVSVNGDLQSGRFVVRGDVSSQFISGLLFALPMLKGDSVIEITGSLESAPYIDMTIYAQSLFGVDVKRCGNVITIKGGSEYKPTDVTVEGDCSNAAFFDALRVLGHDVSVTGINQNTLQGDIVFYEYFKKLCEGAPTLDMSDCPDLAPVVMAVAAAKNGATLTGTKRLKIKESDRGEAMKAELAKFGVKTKVYENKIEVGCGICAPTEPIESHNDHRIVMACAVLLTKTGGKILNAESVNKSFPNFFECLKVLGAEVENEA